MSGIYGCKILIFSLYYFIQDPVIKKSIKSSTYFSYGKIRLGNIAFAHSKSSFAHEKKFFFPGIVICTRKKGFSI